MTPEALLFVSHDDVYSKNTGTAAFEPGLPGTDNAQQQTGV
jgi:hypothetical protein